MQIVQIQQSKVHLSDIQRIRTGTFEKSPIQQNS